MAQREEGTLEEMRWRRPERNGAAEGVGWMGNGGLGSRYQLQEKHLESSCFVAVVAVFFGQ